MTEHRRRQATLYLPFPESGAVESLRSRFNPIQFTLIRAHVTLLREDEVEDWDRLVSRLASLGSITVTLSFGAPVRDGNLVVLPAVESTESFRALRQTLLAGAVAEPRRHEPHITLVHPRNGTCSDAAFEEICAQYTPFTVTLQAVTIIEQADGGRWMDVARFE